MIQGVEVRVYSLDIGEGATFCMGLSMAASHLIFEVEGLKFRYSVFGFEVSTCGSRVSGFNFGV